MEVGVLSVPCPLRAADSCGRDCRPESGPTRTRRTVQAGGGTYEAEPGAFPVPTLSPKHQFFAALANPETVWKGYPILYLVGPGRRTSPGRPTTLPETPAVCTPPRLVPNVLILLQAISKGAKRPHFPARSSRKLRRRALSISRGAKRAGVAGAGKMIYLDILQDSDTEIQTAAPGGFGPRGLRIRILSPRGARARAATTQRGFAETR